MSMRGAARVVCVGDSITFGEHVTSDRRWTTLMALARPEWNVLNRGVNGETTRDGLLRFPMDVQAPRPDVTVIQFGHNDANTWACDNGLPRVSDQSYVANLREMAIRAKHFGSKVIVLAPHRTGLNSRYDARVEKYAKAAFALRGATVVGRPFATPEDLLDGLHLNDLGHQTAARYITTLVEEIL